jgi:DNA repair exonuclease SbcCD ATPase subunit
MFTKLFIKNFQNHKCREVDLGPITVFVGPTDAGKSGAFRALRWACTNRPGGTAFIRSGAKVVKVVVTSGSGTVGRVRGRRNTYTLGGMRYAAFGLGKVPDAVAKVLNVGEVNFQGQHDGPFWFCLSPGQVSRELNQIVSLDLIDRALALAAQGVRQSKSVAGVTEQRLAAARERKAGLAWAKQADAALQQVESLYTTLEARREKRRALRAGIEKVTAHLQARRNAADAMVDAWKGVSAGDKAIAARRKADSVRTALTKVQQLEDERCRLTGRRTALEKELAKVRKCPLCGTARP